MVDPSIETKIPANLKPRIRTNPNNVSVLDGFQNALTGYGVQGIDNQRSFSFSQQLDAFDYLTLDAMYTSNGFARQVIDLMPKEMCRQWVSVENDPDEHLLGYMERLNAQPLFTNALQWANLYGGALIFMVIEDGREMWEPVDFNNIRDIKMLKVYDRFQTTVINFYTQLIDIDRYGHPEIYQIIDPVRGVLYSIHESRTIRFNGVNSTLRFRLANFGWSQSILNLCWDQLVHVQTAYTSASRAMQTNNETVVGVENLMDYLTDHSQVRAIQERIGMFNQTRNTMNALLKDQKETIERLNNSFTDIPAMLKEFGYELCAVTGYPYNKIFGDSTGGLSGAGQYDTSSFYDDVRANQVYTLKPAIDKLLHYIQLSKNSPVAKLEDGKTYKPKFNPLAQENEKTKAETEEINSRTDISYIQNRVMTEEEVREKRGFVDTANNTVNKKMAAQSKDLLKKVGSYNKIPNEEKQVLMTPYNEQPYATSFGPEDKA